MPPDREEGEEDVMGMTREEARNELVLWRNRNSDNGYHYKFVEALTIAIKALEQQPCEDCISRQAVLNTLFYKSDNNCEVVLNKELQDRIKALPHVTPTHKEWIPVSERLPEDLEAVNITWVNHEPEPYYHDIKDRNFTATGIHYRGKWYWYSTTCADYLGEYGSNEVDEVDSAIEIVAWMPLPEPYKAESEE